MELEKPPRRLGAAALREWAHTAVDHLIAHTDEINRMNVFPVADADTGTNMLFTMRTACARVDADVDPGSDVASVASALAEGAMDGARGNSGVILSQILRGMAEVTASAAAELGGPLVAVDGRVLASALRHAIDLIGASVGQAVPGTIVSVLQAAADAAERESEAGHDVSDVAGAAAEAAALALDETPRQLAVLADAGVVDAGGRGLLVLLDALTTTLTGRIVHRDAYQAARAPAIPAATTVAAPPRFEVMYLLSGAGHRDVQRLRERLDQLGDSVAIAASGSGEHYSVHVHSDDAGGAVEAALDIGTPSRIQVTALTGDPGARPSGSWAKDRAVLAVVDGDGAESLFVGEGAHVLRPDAEGLLTAKHLVRALVDVGAAQVMLLPNGYVAAEELVAGCTAAIGWGIDVVPVPAASMVQGLAALAVHDAGRQAVDDGYAMARAAAGARHGSVRLATEEALTWAGTCQPGNGLGIAGDEVLIVAEDVVAAGAGLIDLLLSSGGELVTVLTGAGTAESVGDALREYVHHAHIGTELVTYHTGHGGDAVLVGVE